jgi:protein O-GlcNAc transferase
MSEQILKNYKNTVNNMARLLHQMFNSKDSEFIDNKRQQTIKLLENFVQHLEITDYLLIDNNPIVPKDVFIEMYFNLGTLYKNQIEEVLNKQNNANNILTKEHENEFRKSLNCFFNILRISFENEMATKQIISIFTQLCFYSQNDLQKSLNYLQEALLYSPGNETIHYNLGHIFQKMNKLEMSLVHYKISLNLIQANLNKKEDLKEAEQLRLNCLNGISYIFRSIKQWPQALYYLLKSEAINNTDPDIQNQLGVVYTEMRRTDLAEQSYNKAIKNYDKSFISRDPTFFLSEIYLNLGHMHSYNGDNNKSIECYNKSLQVCPKFTLPFQNKIMNLSYIFDELQDKMYILNQHKLVNKIYEKGNGMFKFNSSFFKTEKINIGIISGDFIDHPVSYFISPLLKNFNTAEFTLTCYSECIIDTKLFNNNIAFKLIKNMSNKQIANIVYNDKIHILLDLSGHTAFNRLDVFALKPSPIQITYIGYPYSTGLNEMDYRITDKTCDNLDVSQKFYTEKLLFLENSFLCYDPNIITMNNPVTKKFTLEITQSPYLTNRYITIGCFNRLNKITDNVIKLFNELMLKFSSVRFVFKTKALINKSVQKTFLNKFNSSVRSRITILDCTISHNEHLLTYNQIDLAIDTFPYSGTTTSCEALFMGVPVFSLYDSEFYFHAQNVTCSILKGSDLQEYIFYNNQELFDKLKSINNEKDDFWYNLKNNTKNKFLSGKVCDQKEYIKNLSNLFKHTFKETKLKYN